MADSHSPELSLETSDIEGFTRLVIHERDDLVAHGVVVVRVIAFGQLGLQLLSYISNSIYHLRTDVNIL